MRKTAEALLKRPPTNNPDDTITIYLTQRQVTVIDKKNADLSRVNWLAHWNPPNQSFYVHRNVQGYGDAWETERLHTVVLERKLGRHIHFGHVTDHIDGDTLNNCGDNLQEVTVQHNTWRRTRVTLRNNTSGYTGVSWYTKDKRWKAFIVNNRKRKQLIATPDKELAAITYDLACLRIRGRNAVTNILTPLHKDYPLDGWWLCSGI